MRLRLKFAAAWEEALWRAARRVLPHAALAESALEAGARAVSDRYTVARERIGRDRDGPRERAARLLYFAVADALKVHLPLAELAPAPRPALRVLDVGAGVGATALGVASFVAAAGLAERLELTLLDRDREAIRVAVTALEELATELRPLASTVRTIAGDAATLVGAGNGYDLVVAQTVLNELPAAARPAALRAWLAALAPSGTLVVIEPALRTTTRELHHLRDELLARGEAVVLAPCPHQAPCPMLAVDRDWCHEQHPWDAPPRFDRLRARIGLRRGGLEMSYLVLVPPGTPRRPCLTYRVVSQPLVSKGQRELVLCGARGTLVRARLLDRDRSEANRAFTKAERGDEIEVEGADAGRIGRETQVRS